MSKQVTQSVAVDIPIILTLANVAVTGLTDADVTAQIRKEGGAFAAKALTGSNFVEVGNGIYDFTLDATDVDTLGSLTIVITGAGIDQSTTIIEVVAASVATSVVSLQTCVISGHVHDATGQPVPGASVSARVVGLPSIEQSQAAVTDDLVTAKTNSNGEFFITLVRLADVEIFISASNFRRRLVVPNQASAQLFAIS
jgi:hypothetical protein